MAHLTRYLKVLCLGQALHLLGSPALAQQAAEPPRLLPRSYSAVAATEPSSNAAVPPPKLHRFKVRARTPGRRLEIRTSDDVTVARCIGSCSLNLPKGEYLASLLDATGEKSPSVDFEVNGPGGIELEDIDAETAATGLGFGLAGLGLATGGFVLMTVGMSHACLPSASWCRVNMTNS